MTLNVVVFPAPFGPISPAVVPSSTSNETSSSAVIPPKRRVTFRSESRLIRSKYPTELAAGSLGEHDLGAARRGDRLALAVRGVGGAEDEPARPVHDASLGAEQAGPRRAVVVDAEVAGQEMLVLLHQRPARAAHRCVEERRDHAAVGAVAAAEEEAGLRRRGPLDD